MEKNSLINDLIANTTISFVFIRKMNYLLNLKTYFKLIIVLVMLASLTSCVDLSGFVDSSDRKTLIKKPNNNVTSKAPRLVKGEVFTMRGGLGIFSIGMNQLADAVKKQFEIPASRSMWYQSYKVSRAIINRYQGHQLQSPIILIGHSLGADEQVAVAKCLNKSHVPVALLVTVDAVLPYTVPPNVKESLNLYKVT
jgi:hypothetical protein